MDIHKTAVIDPNAQLAEDVVIGPFCTIGPDVSIGSGTVLHNGVVVTGKTTIGKNNVFHSYSVVGGDPQDLKYKGEDSLTEIGDDNQFREYVTINKGTDFGGWVTRVGNGNLIMAYVHIAHDCILGDKNIIGNATSLGGHVTIQNRVVISGLVGIIHFVTIGDLAFLGGSSKAVADLPPFMMADGHPFKVRNINQVGLERAGLSAETIDKISQVFRLLYRGNASVAALRTEIVEGHELYCDEVMQMFLFMERTEKGKNGRAKEAERRDV